MLYFNGDKEYIYTHMLYYNGDKEYITHILHYNETIFSLAVL